MVILTKIALEIVFGSLDLEIIIGFVTPIDEDKVPWLICASQASVG